MKIGLDVIEIERVRRTLERHPRFRERCFTKAERAYCESRPNPAQHYAARFAGKEAVGKALGFGVARAFAWKDVEIAGRPKPAVALSGRLEAWSRRVGAGAIDLSMTHSRGIAAAVCIVGDTFRGQISAGSPVATASAPDPLGTPDAPESLADVQRRRIGEKGRVTGSDPSSCLPGP